MANVRRDPTGWVIVDDVPPGVTVIGNPARQIHSGSGAK